MIRSHDSMAPFLFFAKWEVLEKEKTDIGKISMIVFFLADENEEKYEEIMRILNK